MNEDIFSGKAKQIRGDIQKTWGKLTDNQLDQAVGGRDKVLGLIQESYGIAKDEAEKQVKTFEEQYAKTCATADKASGKAA